MNMPAMAVVLPATPAASGGARNSGRNEPDSESAGFPDVLARQHGAEPGKPAAQAPGKKSEGKPGKQAAGQADAEEALSRAGSEQALALPQIALRIAAEVAAVREDSSAGGPPMAGKTATRRAGETMTADLSAKAAVARGITPLASLIAKAGDSTPLLPAAADSATPLIPPAAAATGTASGNRQTSAASSPLNTRQAAGTAGAKQAVLAMQARMQAGEPSPDVAALASFLAGTAPEQTRDGNTPASPVDQAGMQPATGLGHAAAGAASGIAFAAAPGAPAAGTPGAMPAVATPLASPNWGADFSRQFVSIAQGANNMPHTAELRLDPPELGPLRISINISDNTASAVFVSPHAAVRQTVENALPQLQQQLAQAGISLGQTSVSDQGHPDQAAYQSSSSGKHRGAGVGNIAAVPGDGDSSAVRAAARGLASNALVDTFA